MWEVTIKPFSIFKHEGEMQCAKVEVKFEFDRLEDAVIFGKMCVEHSNIESFEIGKKEKIDGI